MADFPSFEEISHQAEQLEELQDMLSDPDDVSSSRVCEFIKNSFLINDLRTLAEELVDLFVIRPDKESYIIRIIKKLIKKSKSVSELSNLKHAILNIFYPKHASSRPVAILRSMLDAKIFKSTEIIDVVLEQTLDYIDFLMFAPEIFSCSKDMFEQFKKEFSKQINQVYNIDALFEDDFSFLKECYKYKSVPNSPQFCIMKDDIDLFQSCYASKNEFNINKKLVWSPFGFFNGKCFDKKSNEVSLISYAANFGSIKIFKFLYLNMSKEELIRKKNTILMHCATVGNNPEIIHILEHANLPFNKAIKTAIYFRREELYEWFTTVKLGRKKVEKPDFIMKTAISCIRSNNMKFLSYVLDYSKSLERDKQYQCLRYAVQYNRMFMTRFLVSHALNEFKKLKIIPQNDQPSLLCYAVMQNDIDMVKFVISFDSKNKNHPPNVQGKKYPRAFDIAVKHDPSKKGTLCKFLKKHKCYQTDNMVAPIDNAGCIIM
ncbi:hypothetical protein TRFO_03490 [Tritrichomonas foetus]|uniref:DUF3447 domain-containing protein n=1 Tax=Tritrichomonas foetus TaxID=1144522 RepID=A0A1J4KQ79_9EUKA|nr:hypothetical protein TRFO_03490 [Tritrichomonas foetus]|eukprot:OHT13064.1 hypothetical protein TRFO_03490 [Tritrichomonas foetus]